MFVCADLRHPEPSEAPDTQAGCSGCTPQQYPRLELPIAILPSQGSQGVCSEFQCTVACGINYAPCLLCARTTAHDVSCDQAARPARPLRLARSYHYQAKRLLPCRRGGFLCQYALSQVNWNSPAAAGNFGSVYYGTIQGTPCVVKCPKLEPFSLKLFDTEVRPSHAVCRRWGTAQH